MKALSLADKKVLGGALLATIVAFVCAHERFGPIVAFVTAAAALSLVAMVVGHATEHLGAKLGPGPTGVLQSALGNLPELFVCIFSLKAGLVAVVQTALIGSILANSLLVLGLAMLLGGLKHGTQKFGGEAPKMISVLMVLATAALIIPTLAHELHTPASKHESTMSVAVAVLLLICFFATLKFFMAGDKAVVSEEAAEEAHAHPKQHWPLGLAAGILACAGVGAAFVSEWFVDALGPAIKTMGISESFAGLVVVAIAGNAIENLVGIQLALKNKMDYGVSVILNSSLQIALVLVPVIVLYSVFFTATPFTLVLPPLLAGCLVLTSLVTSMVVNDGESIWVEGLALIGLYVVIAIAFWWG